MAMTPVTNWISTYESKQKDYMEQSMNNPAADPAEWWRLWVNDAAQGIQAGPPYSLSMGTTDMGAFAPVKFPKAGTPVQCAIVLANAWKAWYMAIKWNPCPPIPPFSVIEKVEASPVGVPLAYATLLSGLIAEFAIVPPDPLLAFKLKATSFGSLFYTATLSAGIQITGKSTSSPPVPLVIPMLPIL